jgi:adhesin/invasin
VAGSYTVTASAGNASASFSLTNTAGAAASISASAGTPQSAVINTAFATALQATVKDAFGNVVSGVAVTFAAPASGPGGAFAAGAPVTNSAGVATAPTLTANATAGGFTATATAAGVATPASFALNNTSGTPASMTPSGTPQSATAGSAFGAALQVTVKDIGSNPVSGVVVTFTAPASGASGSFAASAVVQTNALGVATAPTFTANGTAGTYAVTATGSGLSATFTLTNTPAPLTAAPSPLAFFSSGAAPDPQSLTITSGGSAVAFTISGVPAWLTLSATTGATPATITVSANPIGLPLGSTSVTLTITPGNGTAAFLVPVSITKANPPQNTLVATPVYVTFAYERGGTVPPVQVVSISKDDGTPVTNPQIFFFSSGNWLSATSGNSLHVSVNPAGLPLGRYGSVILVVSGNASVEVRVILEVTDPPVLVANRPHLDFSWVAGGAKPDPQMLWVSSTVRNIAFTAAVDASSGWLSVSPASGTTVAPITVSVDPTGLSSGFHTGTITIQSADATNSPLSVTITVFVGP